VRIGNDPGSSCNGSGGKAGENIKCLPIADDYGATQVENDQTFL